MTYDIPICLKNLDLARKPPAGAMTPVTPVICLKGIAVDPGWRGTYIRGRGTYEGYS
jgi:hypothetical protein